LLYSNKRKTPVHVFIEVLLQQKRHNHIHNAALIVHF
jgi:hypothetical protein